MVWFTRSGLRSEYILFRPEDDQSYFSGINLLYVFYIQKSHNGTKILLRLFFLPNIHLKTTHGVNAPVAAQLCERSKFFPHVEDLLRYSQRNIVHFLNIICPVGIISLGPCTCFEPAFRMPNFVPYWRTVMVWLIVFWYQRSAFLSWRRRRKFILNYTCFDYGLIGSNVNFSIRSSYGGSGGKRWTWEEKNSAPWLRWVQSHFSVKLKQLGYFGRFTLYVLPGSLAGTIGSECQRSSIVKNQTRALYLP